MGCDEPKLVPRWNNDPIPKEKHLPEHLEQEVDKLIFKLVKEAAPKGADVQRWFRLRHSKNLKQCAQNRIPVLILEQGEEELMPADEISKIFSVAVSEELLNIPWCDLDKEIRHRVWILTNQSKLGIGLHWELLPGPYFSKS